MKLLSIGSSSSGNSTLLYNDDTSILIDCGVPVKRVLEKTGKKKFDGLFITHEHGDHVSGAGPLGRKTKTPIYINNRLVESRKSDFKNCDLHDLDGTMSISVGSMTVKPFTTKHDSKYSLGFTIADEKSKLFYLVDSGSISKLMSESAKDCTSFFIECDYDEELMAKYDGYDQLLKDRITSNFGHLSTQQSLEFVSTLDLEKIKVIIFGHLSERTNNPEKVKERIKERFPDYTSKFLVTPLMEEVEL